MPSPQWMADFLAAYFRAQGRLPPPEQATMVLRALGRMHFSADPALTPDAAAERVRSSRSSGLLR